MKIPLVGAEFHADGQRIDGQIERYADRHDEGNICLFNPANAPKKNEYN
jgi:hypothetical protein